VNGILIDINIQGHGLVLLLILEGQDWGDIWARLGMRLLTFRDLGLDRESSDAVVWQTCQQHQLILMTANRNDDGEDSLENTLRTQNQPSSLPVFTIGSSERIFHSREYAHRVVERLLDYLIDIENYRGAGRLYLP
jgi:hypothetical protein